MTNSKLTPQLSVRDLKVAFRSFDDWKTVVKGVSFDIGRKETVAIVGESGSGKSVTALSVMQLLNRRATRLEGAIEFAGRNLLDLAESDMRALRGKDISMIFQEPMTSLNPILTVGKQISEVLIKHKGMTEKAALEEAVRVLEKVRIPAARSRLSHYPHQFSGGMRQRVMIASAIACSPKLLIADEPTTALDVTIQAQIIDLIKDLQAEDGMAVMFITHDMGVVAEIADRTVVMFRGSVVEKNETAAIFRSQAHPYTRSLLSAVPELGAMEGSDQPKRLTIIDPISGEVRTPESAGRAVEAGEPVLEVRNLVVRFDSRGGVFNRVVGRVHAVEDVSFSLRRGETLSLVGESGSGKSTTGRAALQLIPAQAGEVFLEGENIASLSSKAFMPKRRKIQMIFQDPMASLDPRVTIGDTIAEPILVH
ncbi:ABC transporter ATP-binding protein, partial [Salmonella enterica subsp. enterica]|nr:ABC transporter ATP-binding protein [Salmonella enterica subsp. enterica serovar Enteritidis]